MGVLSPQFLLVGEHPPLNTHKQNSTTKPFRASIRSASGGCTSLGQPTHTCACSQRTATPPPPLSQPFSCIPENNAKMREWFLDKYAASAFNTCPHCPFHCMARPPIKIHVDSLVKPMACHTTSPIPLHRLLKVRYNFIRDETMGIYSFRHQQCFLKTWGVEHRVSLAYFSQCNGRAEVAVKAAKRLLAANMNPNDDFNNALFYERCYNCGHTPDPDCDMSSAEIILVTTCAMSFCLLIAYLSFPIVRYDVLGVKHDEPTKTLFVAASWTQKPCTMLKQSPLRALHSGDRVFFQNQTGNYPRKSDKVGIKIQKIDFINLKNLD